MLTSRFTESQIAAVLEETEAGAEVAEAELSRKHGNSAVTSYYWRSKFGEMSASDLRHPPL